MKNVSRRYLLKSGIAASAGLFTAAGALNLTSAGAQTQSLAAVSNGASDAAPIDSDPPREKLSLDAGWLFHLGDADEAGKDFGFGAPATERTFAKSGSIQLNNVDESSWQKIDLPHDWALDLPFVQVQPRDITAHAAHGGKPLGRNYPATSIGWYRRRFVIPKEDEGKCISIDFDGVFRDAIVVLNGYYLGRNFSGYAPFTFDVSDYLNYGGSNLLVVRADATLGEGWFYEGAGIYRHTWLRKTDPLHLAQWGTYVRSDLRKKDALLTIGTAIVNDNRATVTGRLVSRIYDAADKVVATAPARQIDLAGKETTVLETQVSLAQPALWSIDNPNLYRVVTQIESDGRVTDRDDTTFGIRTIRFDPDQGFFLNDVPVKIKGTCNHQDHGGVGIALPDRIHFDRVALLKEMGSNAWRTAHNMVTPELLDACDRLGMMVMSETRMMASTPEGISELERMVKRDRNHPSIIIWSLANEEYRIQGSPMGAKIFSSMKDSAKQLDPTRPVTAAMNGGWGKGISEVVDVQGFNYWNDGQPHGPGMPKNLDEFHKQLPHLPSFGSEQAAGHAARGIYEDDPARGYVGAYPANTPEAKCDTETWWSVYAVRPYLAGGFSWVGYDYRGEPKPYDRIAVTSQSGVMDNCGFPKDVYHYCKAWWGTQPVLYVFPHWNWAGREGQSLGVRCHTNLDSVELFVNGQSLGMKDVPRNSHVYWNVPYQPGAIEARGYKVGKLVLTDRRETTGPAAKLVLRCNQTTFAADGLDVSSIAAEVQDVSGRVVPIALNKVTFTLTGDGRIIGVGNGDPSCREADRPDTSFTATRSAFNGLCMAFIQSTKESGSIQVTAAADGLEPSNIVIQTTPAALRPAVE